MKGSHLGYVVVTYNQASGCPGFDGEPSLYEDVDEAIEARDREQAETASIGRREHHVVAEVIELDPGEFS